MFDFFAYCFHTSSKNKHEMQKSVVVLFPKNLKKIENDDFLIEFLKRGNTRLINCIVL